MHPQIAEARLVLPVGGLVDEYRVVAKIVLALLLLAARLLSGEEDRAAVGRPSIAAYAALVPGELVGLTTAGRQTEHLRFIVDVAGEGQVAAIRRETEGAAARIADVRARLAP